MVCTQRASGAITVESTMRKMTMKGGEKASGFKWNDFLYNTAALTSSSLHLCGARVVSGRTRYCLANTRVQFILSQSRPTRITFYQT
jgi:hypothetical protein